MSKGLKIGEVVINSILREDFGVGVVTGQCLCGCNSPQIYWKKNKVKEYTAPSTLIRASKKVVLRSFTLGDLNKQEVREWEKINQKGITKELIGF